MSQNRSTWSAALVGWVLALTSHRSILIGFVHVGAHSFIKAIGHPPWLAPHTSPMCSLPGSCWDRSIRLLKTCSFGLLCEWGCAGDVSSANVSEVTLPSIRTSCTFMPARHVWYRVLWQSFTLALDVRQETHLLMWAASPYKLGLLNS